MESIIEQAYLKLGHPGAMISYSKSMYIKSNPHDLVIFNSNVYVQIGEKYTKIWFGDINVTKDHAKLKTLAENIFYPLYVLREMDGRFENEAEPLISNAVFKITPDGKETLGSNESLVFDTVTLKRI